MDKLVKIPGSKSEAVRAVILASVLGAKIINASKSEDLSAACNIAKSLGAETIWNGSLDVVPGNNISAKANVYSSATVYRIGLISKLALFGEADITMSSQLASRDMGKLYDFLKNNNVVVKKLNSRVYCKGFLDKDEYSINGDNSSQLLSAVLISFALRRAKGRVYYENIPSFKYVLLTLEMLKHFNIEYFLKDNCIDINATSAKKAIININSDASALAPFLAARALKYDFDIVSNIDYNQADSVFISILKEMGYCDSNMRFSNFDNIKAIDVDCNGFPDIVPFISVVCTQSEGTSYLRNLSRLRNKESDRLSNTVKILAQLGADISINGNDIIIKGKKGKWTGGVDLKTNADHRMAMLAAIASLNCNNINRIEDCNSVNKSYPDFWKDYETIGGKYESMG